MIALLGIYPRNTKIVFQRNMGTQMFIAALPIIAKFANNLSVHWPMHGQRNAYIGIIYNGILLHHKNKTNNNNNNAFLLLARSYDWARGYEAKRKKPVRKKDKHHVISLICGIQERKPIRKMMKKRKRQIQTQTLSIDNKLMVTKREVSGEWSK